NYCHTPPRFLWHLSGEGNRGILELLLSKLRLYDQVSAQRVDFFIAGSKNAQSRIKKIYRRESKVVYPFIDLERFKNVEAFDGGYFLVIARKNKYKRIDLAKAACEKLNIPLKIISGGLTDQIVVAILAGCRALIIAGEEDFGLTSLEAQVLGKPVVAYAAGGAMETTSGIFFEEQTVDSLVSALKKLSSKKMNPQDALLNAKRFSKENFIRNFKQTVASLVYTY
ncbi:MAG: glycosyltransferase, partial [Candidatus Daviesbacteria bacterium]|nr:glycosyltransferase [Candidatus Daviesbacteria bacterium]